MFPPPLFFAGAELPNLFSHRSSLTACNLAIEIRGVICLDLRYTRLFSRECASEATATEMALCSDNLISTIPEWLQHKIQKGKICSFIMY